MGFAFEENRSVNSWRVSGEYGRSDPLGKWCELFHWKHPMTQQSGVLESHFFFFFPNVL